MFCTKCGVQLEESHRFCPQCGHPAREGYATKGAPILSRPMDQKKLGGVCSGFARYFDMDITLMRILWIAAFFLSGGLMSFVYIAAWILMPKDWPATPHPSTDRVVAY